MTVQRIKFASERQRYKLMAHDDRFAILVKPFNAQKTYLYTIADLQRQERGACNLIFGLPCDVDTPDGAREALGWLNRGEMEVSYRNCVPLLPAETVALRAAMGRPA